MNNVFQPLNLLIIAFVGWLNQHQQAFIAYLIEENRVLKDQLEGKLLSAKIQTVLIPIRLEYP